MAYVINCTCGVVLRGEDEDEVVRNAEAHVQEAHPEMAGTVGREEFLAMAEEQ